MEINETWKSLDLNPHYLVSNLGRVMNVHSKKILKPRTNGKNKYLKVTLGSVGKIGLKNSGSLKTKSYFVHYLVLYCFIGGRPQGHTINHINSDRTDNNLENLEYVTPKQNSRHAMDKGFDPRVHKNNKLTLEDAKQIRIKYSQGLDLKVLSQEFKVSKGHIKDIINNKKWRDL